MFSLVSRHLRQGQRRAGKERRPGLRVYRRRQDQARRPSEKDPRVWILYGETSPANACLNHGFRTNPPTFAFQGFGRANHAVSTEKLKVRYPDYEVTWSNEGYWAWFPAAVVGTPPPSLLSWIEIDTTFVTLKQKAALQTGGGRPSVDFKRQFRVACPSKLHICRTVEGHLEWTWPPCSLQKINHYSLRVGWSSSLTAKQMFYAWQKLCHISDCVMSSYQWITGKIV